MADWLWGIYYSVDIEDHCLLHAEQRLSADSTQNIELDYVPLNGSSVL